MRCHLCTERTTRDQERCPGGHPTKLEPSQILLHLQQLVVVWSKEKNLPFQCLATSCIAKQSAFKEFMRGCIKFLFKIQYECVNLSSIVKDFSPIIYYRSQLSFIAMSFPECMLPIWQEFIFIKMSHDIWTYYVFEYLPRYTSQGNWVIIARKWPVTLLEKGGRYLQETIPLGFHQCQLIADLFFVSFLFADRKKLGMDSADPQNRSEWRGCFRERLVKNPNPR